MTSASSSPACSGRSRSACRAGDDGQGGGGQVGGQHGLVGGQARERVGNGRAVVELESDDGRDGQP